MDDLDLKKELDEASMTEYPDKNLDVKEELTGHILKRFDAGKGATAKAHSVKNEICHLSKEGIEALRRGDEQTADEKKLAMEKELKRLAKIDLPLDSFWQFHAEAAQEVAEYHVVRWLYPLLFTDSQLRTVKMPSAKELLITPQAWLAGIIDGITEMSKLLSDRLCDDEQLTGEERLGLRKRFRIITRQIKSYLDQFADSVPAVINNSRRPGFHETFRGGLGRVKGAVERTRDTIIEALDRVAI
ncbi:MAG: hypothetical protein AAB389_02820 [Patescibacteria group bacterium]